MLLQAAATTSPGSALSVASGWWLRVAGTRCWVPSHCSEPPLTVCTSVRVSGTSWLTPAWWCGQARILLHNSHHTEQASLRTPLLQCLLPTDVRSRYTCNTVTFSFSDGLHSIVLDIAFWLSEIEKYLPMQIIFSHVYERIFSGSSCWYIYYLCFAALVKQLFNPQLRLSPVVWATCCNTPPLPPPPDLSVVVSPACAVSVISCSADLSTVNLGLAPLTHCWPQSSNW